jgi:hypothetical protein
MSVHARTRAPTPCLPIIIYIYKHNHFIASRRPMLVAIIIFIIIISVLNSIGPSQALIRRKQREGSNIVNTHGKSTLHKSVTIYKKQSLSELQYLSEPYHNFRTPLATPSIVLVVGIWGVVPKGITSPILTEICPRDYVGKHGRTDTTDFACAQFEHTEP